ncbi:MAG: SIMPL domain-containing protein [Candidatus Curtissbacteria bacterium]|nr:SIMPL domain-containing protein [Candidatus Curtissbacteria bacterium]
MRNKPGYTALIWPIVIVILTLAAFWLRPWEAKTQETISVTAEGRTQATPNVAKVSATIETTNDNLDKAREENSQKVSNLVSAIKQLGVEEKDIKTQNLSGGPGYETSVGGTEPAPMIYPAPPRPNTNQVSTTLEITVRNFDKSDEVLAALTQNGATNLYGPNLTIDDETMEQARSKAREDAVEEAKSKAEELAKLSGRKLGKAVKIQEQGDFGYPVPMMARSEADLMQKASQIQPGQNEVTINLAVDFALK